MLASNSLLSLESGTSKTFCNLYTIQFQIVQVTLCAEIMPKISFEGTACPLMKPCFTQLELLSVQRYAAQKSSSSYIESQWGVKFCVSFVSKAYGLSFCRTDHYRHSACLDIMDLWLMLQLKEDFGKTFPLQQEHTLLHFSILQQP